MRRDPAPLPYLTRALELASFAPGRYRVARAPSPSLPTTDGGSSSLTPPRDRRVWFAAVRRSPPATAGSRQRARDCRNGGISSEGSGRRV